MPGYEVIKNDEASTFEKNNYIFKPPTFNGSSSEI